LITILVLPTENLLNKKSAIAFMKLLAGFIEQTALHWRNKEVLLGTIKTWICNIFCASFRRKLPLKGSDSWYGFQGNELDKVAKANMH